TAHIAGSNWTLSRATRKGAAAASTTGEWKAVATLSGWTVMPSADRRSAAWVTAGTGPAMTSCSGALWLAMRTSRPKRDSRGAGGGGGGGGLGGAGARRHGAGRRCRGVAHRPPALAGDAEQVLRGEDAGDVQGRDLAEAVARDRIGPEAEAREDPPRGEARRR